MKQSWLVHLLTLSFTLLWRNPIGRGKEEGILSVTDMFKREGDRYIDTQMNTDIYLNIQ